jgi:hypothetical protein
VAIVYMSLVIDLPPMPVRHWSLRAETGQTIQAEVTFLPRSMLTIRPAQDAVFERWGDSVLDEVAWNVEVSDRFFSAQWGLYSDEALVGSVCSAVAHRKQSTTRKRKAPTQGRVPNWSCHVLFQKSRFLASVLQADWRLVS